MKDCKEHMLEHYPFEETKDRNAPKEIKKVREEQKKLNQELASAASKEAKDKATARLKDLGRLLNMLSAIQELDGKILDLEDMEPEDDYEDEHDIYVVEAPKEEPAINAVFEQCKTHFKLAQTLPTSFEKSLMKINYCFALYCQENQPDEILGLKTKDQRLERLREELK
jgi:hypothetical protein